MAKYLVLFSFVFFLNLVNGQDRLIRRVTRPVRCFDAEKASIGDEVSIHYTGRLASNGKQFDSSDGGDPITFTLGKGVVIDGWEEGLLGTCEGEGLELTIPPKLAYGERGAGNGLIPPNAKLIFTLSLEKLTKSLGIEILQAKDCTRDEKTREKDKIKLHYVAKKANGTVFDSSYDRGEPLEMTIGKAGIVGWDKGASGACIGEVRRVIMPPHLGYGDHGTVIVDMEILGRENRVLSFLDRISSGNFGRG